VLLVVIVCGVAWWLWRYPDQPGPARTAAVTVEIPPGSGLAGIKRHLTAAGVIPDDFRFVLLAKWLGVARSLQAGEYAFPPGATPRAVLLALAEGRTVLHAITLAEGLTIHQAAEVIQAGGWGGREEFMGLVTDPELINGFGLSGATLEGYLFPDTYFFAKGTALRPMVTAMVKRMQRVLAEEEGAGVGAGPSRLSRYQALILASIIEKETALATERPLVAKVFLNRLRTGMKLQADPTVIYGLAKFGEPLTKADLATPNPYNTYAQPGLPRGPICSPGRTAIAAVFRPAPLDYYYFVAQNDGSHYFSRTLAEHNQAVARYRKKRLSNRE
jgi:UPF0755 protein